MREEKKMGKKKKGRKGREGKRGLGLGLGQGVRENEKTYFKGKLFLKIEKVFCSLNKVEPRKLASLSNRLIWKPEAVFPKLD